MNVLVFDIETVPDLDGGRRLHGLDGLSDEDVAKALFHLRAQETGGSEFLRLHLHRIVAISAVRRSGETLEVSSLGSPDSPESDLIRAFFDRIERDTPTLVSWNGSGFDLPVLHYRALLHGVSAPRYWDAGEEDREFKWNNYLSRYHSRHTDLMDVLAGYQPRANAPLGEIASLLGFPGKLGMDGAQVWARFLAGDTGAIRDYCETDVLNTYLVWLRFELMRGHLLRPGYDAELTRLREYLKAGDRAHFSAFLSAWPAD
ncbi:3'-5' exonuclease [Thiohalobacter sp. COW1]|uniref:3'-5' exonuclease n=1 Tax=Thiohalobacter thiocyanaticus TaxID=585455 RepID=A0A1Z4VPD8_9GAMM|nr:MULTISPECIES: 3'-5' exonuclease [Thiohalobacter]BAZ93480.1 3'-5' exonuclease [Thiohalobacter thiocyanaticus]BCO31478.1 3'-5' exonuclease [Thiohalobacter sp. COW1]